MVIVSEVKSAHRAGNALKQEVSEIKVFISNICCLRIAGEKCVRNLPRQEKEFSEGFLPALQVEKSETAR